MGNYADDAVTDFLQAQLAKLDALVDSDTVVIFADSRISPGRDITQHLIDSSFPIALVNDEGGTPHPHLYKQEQRRFAVTVAVLQEVDVVGEQGEVDLLNICGIVRFGDGTNPGLELDTSNAEVSFAGDGPVQTVVLDQGQRIFTKSIGFTYELKRS